eukprot:TRINITY_DN21507_c0_g1_i2.p3 TRINITY_DN21507_c0_g1~~TRINITY_DN21507_c0_g1_i2.p3  ORF type:complete len:110 (+),score=26.56 TRINITY_DN21507_c0_g1_i2:164-493(+)
MCIRDRRRVHGMKYDEYQEKNEQTSEIYYPFKDMDKIFTAVLNKQRPSDLPPILSAASSCVLFEGIISEMLEYRTDSSEQIVIYYFKNCLLYTSPSPRDLSTSRMPSSA